MTEPARVTAENSPREFQHSYWLLLGDGSRESAPVAFTERALKRRARVDPVNFLIDERDYPVSASLIDAVSATGARVRQVSRWLNAVSVEANQEHIERLVGIPAIQRIDLVRPLRAAYPDVADVGKSPGFGARAEEFAYGFSLFQNTFINAVKLHRAGYTGKGVLIAVLDSGFELDHRAFDSANVLDQWDFVHGDASIDEAECPEQINRYQQSYHGTLVWAVIAANVPDTLMGVAPGADFVLAKTEITCDGLEIKIEEDNWIAASEWADSLGADIISSSLGYAVFADSGSYVFGDLDGNTARITIAADIAASKNILVVTSAGNERLTSWGAISTPADGDSVLTVGAVLADSTLAAFSSPGPTADGRIKPDIVTLGVGVTTALHSGGLTAASGTSLAAPLVAGGAALALQIDPDLTANRLLERIRAAGSRSSNPDNNYGWGLYDATKSSTIIQIVPVDDIWLTVGDQISVDITTSGLAEAVPVLSALDPPAWAEFTDNGDGTGWLLLRGTPDNPTQASIGLQLDVGYFVDTAYINVVTYGGEQESVSIGPNPFTDSVSIFVGPEAGRLIAVSIFNTAGELVWEKVNNLATTADTPIRWLAINQRGESIAAGVYLAYVQTDRRSYRIKLLKAD
ncbi:MAG: S8 family peptidase [candidate division Zixibacteria bacterium]|nr:S8 family peptidase [candidate division Zixibacteria bacterium]